jgi:hypothetical protein
MLPTSTIKRINARRFEITTAQEIVPCTDVSSVGPVGSTPATMNSHQEKPHHQADSSSDCVRAAYTSADACARTPYNLPRQVIVFTLLLPATWT